MRGLDPWHGCYPREGPSYGEFPGAYSQEACARQTIDAYHGGLARLVSHSLEQLQSQKIDVQHLVEINSHVNTVTDLEQLRDGFKQLLDSLPAR